LDVLLSFIENPHDSSRKVALQHDIDKKSVLKISKNNKFHPYKAHLVQELNEDDFDRRIEFCELMVERIEIQLKNIKITEKCYRQKC